ncbi:UNVERIFIED_CONTAM: hypothetical protein Sradi_4424100 [Sesamum radiatum]|uniref:Reverse transcriptase zinc-binding domain-containing protein n=1 Tax=Sesamum radiatum TaxID=300843 RepID=A0AAW2NRA1_SESRA
MTCFDIPEGILCELEAMMANFFWQGGGEAKIHWLAWHKLCRPKAEGSLGFRRLKEFNSAMLAKQAWRVFSNPQCMLYQMLQQKFAMANWQWGVGCYSWGSLAPKTELIPIDLPAKNTSWVYKRDNRQDDIIWHYEKQGKFSVSSAYTLACKMKREASSSYKPRKWNFVWGLRLAPKIKLFVWKVCLQALPTMTNLRRGGVKLSVGCPLCDFLEEDIMHALVKCPFARLVWALSEVPWRLVDPSTKDAEEWLRGMNQRAENGELESIAATSSCLWLNRNLRIF